MQLLHHHSDREAALQIAKTIYYTKHHGNSGHIHNLPHCSSRPRVEKAEKEKADYVTLNVARHGREEQGRALGKKSGPSAPSDSYP